VRTAAVVLVVLALAVGGCGDADEPAGIPVATDRCEAPEFPVVQVGFHLDEGQDPPDEYSSVPATSGWHSAGDPMTGVFDEPLPDRELVLTLEIGHVVAAYDPDALDPADIQALQALATGTYEGRLTVAPYEEEMNAALVINGWGVRQPCTAFDQGALDRFIAAFQRRAPGADSWSIRGSYAGRTPVHPPVVLPCEGLHISLASAEVRGLCRPPSVTTCW
jgi:hypothetical protein